MEKLLATISEAGQACGLGRSSIYELIRDGKIKSVKSGKRRLIVVESLKSYVTSLQVAA